MVGPRIDCRIATSRMDPGPVPMDSGPTAVSRWLCMFLWFTVNIRHSRSNHAVVCLSFHAMAGRAAMNAGWPWWRHQMETFSALLALCAGNSPGPVNSPHKGQWCGALMFSLICAWINGWVNNRKAGDLRRHRAHYAVTVMVLEIMGDHAPLW